MMKVEEMLKEMIHIMPKAELYQLYADLVRVELNAPLGNGFLQQLYNVVEDEVTETTIQIGKKRKGN